MLSLGYKEELYIITGVQRRALCYQWGIKRSSMLSLGYKGLYVITGV